MSELEEIENKINRVNNIAKAIDDLMELTSIEDMDQEEIIHETRRIMSELDDLELRLLLNTEEDKKNAILTVHPGAGGADSCDWAGMLLRMYERWLERKGFNYRILDLQTAEEGGIKDATLEVKGDYAYGFLKYEAGIHRLVRLSPFDAAHRRHTSFASVFVYPEFDEIRVEIKPDDLKIETYRASGHGGQHVNKTSSAVRITHIPTNITVQCQNERSQHHNRNTALRILQVRLYEHYRRIDEAKKKKFENQKTEISWGRQIRSYVLHPYRLVKDHRTDVQIGNIDAVLDGEIDDFIEAAMKKKGVQNE